MMEDDTKIENSRLSQKLMRAGMEVEVLLYRIEGSHEGWTLEVGNEENASTVWDELFETDQAALDEVKRPIEKEGTSTFLHPSRDELH